MISSIAFLDTTIYKSCTDDSKRTDSEQSTSKYLVVPSFIPRPGDPRPSFQVWILILYQNKTQACNPSLTSPKKTQKHKLEVTWGMLHPGIGQLGL